jgi:hypothetical protein
MALQAGCPRLVVTTFGLVSNARRDTCPLCLKRSLIGEVRRWNYRSVAARSAAGQRMPDTARRSYYADGGRMRMIPRNPKPENQTVFSTVLMTRGLDPHATASNAFGSEPCDDFSTNISPDASSGAADMSLSDSSVSIGTIVRNVRA